VNLSDAASNLVEKVFGGGLADLTPQPKTLLREGPGRAIYKYHPVVEERGGPILLVPPLAAPATCFDLRRGCSLAEHLVAQGRSTYLVDYGPIAFSDRRLGIERWVHEILPDAIRAVSEHAGGQDVRLVGWCLGGIFSLLTAAADSSLPISGIATIATPVDFTMVPLMAPLRPLVDLTGGVVLGSLIRVLGGAPAPIVRKVFQLSSVDKMITKPYAIAMHLDDREFLAQIEAVDRFTGSMYAYPGRTFGQMYHRLFRANDLAEGFLSLGGQRIELGDVTVPTLVVAGSGDVIAPAKSVHALTTVLTGAKEVRYELAPGGHLGVLTGRVARATTWEHLDSWLEDVA
jgi:polyhydroxyalkanoate synthase